jgi:hypothetical protein
MIELQRVYAMSEFSQVIHGREAPPALHRKFRAEDEFFYVLLFPPAERGVRICSTHLTRTVHNLMEEKRFTCTDTALTRLVELENHVTPSTKADDKPLRIYAFWVTSFEDSGVERFGAHTYREAKKMALWTFADYLDDSTWQIMQGLRGGIVRRPESHEPVTTKHSGQLNDNELAESGITWNEDEQMYETAETAPATQAEPKEAVTQ